MVSGDTTTIVQILLGGVFEHAPEICLFHWWNFFWQQAKFLVLGLLSYSARLSGFL